MAINQIKQMDGYLGAPPTKETQQFMVIEDRVHKVYTVVVHEFKLGDVDDVEIYAAQPLWEWQESDMGKWVMSHALESPMWHRRNEMSTWEQRFIITAKLKDKDYTFWQLKWGSTR